MKKIYLGCFLLGTFFANAQTEIDAIMMSKNQFCVGSVYQYSSWDEYWEGTNKRENLNMGTVSTQSIGVMGNYGIANKVNVLFNIPYVITNATAGTMKGQEGFQDLSLTVKYMPFEKKIKNATYSLYALGGYSTPVTNYAVDYLPLSLGLGSQVATFRLMGDYQLGIFFATLSGAYLFRSNVTIERNSYYTDEMHYTNEVDMPNLININGRIGYRSDRLIAEAIIDNSVTQSGGFDITQNNMPFPSNTMNALRLGTNIKYTLKKIPELAFIGGTNYVIDGRNVGQSTSFYGGAFYVINFNKKAK
ncbi:hypothetical protein [Flavobacterium granuli]|uniref:MetA-pathway of phenol degradation n=1 Tax=Flavobacterium granuli TaxID=280093 RepID=A0ABU1RZG6_9FLAO|nr:hypothetical protein [Flavobacterium granuli]MDR6844164.1 hypothetical protein [Flavobacterium granuli]